MSSGCATEANFVVQKVASSKMDINKPWIWRLSSRSLGLSSSSFLSMVLRNPGSETCGSTWEYTGRVFELSHHSDSDPYVKLQDGFRNTNFCDSYGYISMQTFCRGKLRPTSSTSPSKAFTSHLTPEERSSRLRFNKDVPGCRWAANFHLKPLKQVASVSDSNGI
jgi:hypothetical protein